MRWPLAALVLLGLVFPTGAGRAGAPPAQPKAGPDPVNLAALKQAGDWKEALAAARWLEKVYKGARTPEAVRMLIAIADGTWTRPDRGWFGPGQARYDWNWLARLHGVKEGGIALKQFRGPTSLFRCLDRDRDGRISADDLDWSERSPYLRQTALVDRLFMRINTRGDGKIKAEDLLAFFKAAAGGKDHLSPQDLRDALLAAPPRAPLAPGDFPSQAVLVRALFAGELGSLNEGPAVDAQAPDFALKTPDGKQTVQLSKLLGPKPIVLVLGNYTCPPFRRLTMGIEELYQRYKDRATFLGVYVREAHPTDGWAMAANARAGVTVKQPTTYQDRVSVCTQFCEKVRPTIPYVVDEINDPVGNAYSGMPGRLYVIDPNGKVAYKSGRGPFGFKVGELEQALVMSLLEFPPPAAKPVQANRP
jgi:peroxiredoxin